MPEPRTDYDTVETFAVDPPALAASARLIVAEANEIIESLAAVQNALQQVSLGWAGRTSDEVRAFSARWQEVTAALFGTQEDPERGALMVVANGVATAGGLFARTEHALTEFFTLFGEGLVSDDAPSGDTSGFGPRETIDDPDVSAVTQRW